MEGASLRGSREAKIAILEFTDFECPFCGKLAREALSPLMSRYVDAGKVLLAVRNLPLEQIHKSALGAAGAAICAGDQGQYWQMHDALFADQEHLDRASIRERQAALGLDVVKSDLCIESPATKKRIAADTDAARALGVSGTPTLLIGVLDAGGRVKVTRRVSGAKSADEVEGLISELLNQR